MQSVPTPLTGMAIYSFPMPIFIKRMFKEAEKYIAEGRKLFPENLVLQNLYIFSKFCSGDYDEVIKSVKSLLAKNGAAVPENLLGLLSMSYMKKGNMTESNNITRQIKSITPGNNSVNYALARIYSHLQMNDSSFARLEKSFNNRETELRLLKIDPIIDNLKKDPRYMDLCHRYGFDRYK